MKKTIVILANSVKNNQHCIAGKDIITKKWVRPVSDAEGSELSHNQAKCQNPHGLFPINLLQKIEIEFSQEAPLINQPENIIITDEVWLQRYKLEWNDLNSFLDNPVILWNNESNSGIGENDRVDYHQISMNNIKIEQSLYLIRTDDAKVIVTTNIENRKRIRVSFMYNKTTYNLATTDPTLWKDYSLKDIGEYQFATPKILCISLAGKFDDGFCYKLVVSAI
jgi:hypothetical protein